MKRTKQILGLVVIVVTLVIFGHYWQSHPKLWWQLQNVNPLLILGLLGLYCLVITALTLAYDALLRLSKVRLPLQENLLLTMYSTIVNFFGPLQSGPGFRMVYLRKRHKVPIRTYAFFTLFYYAMFAGLSVLFLLVSLPVWLFIALIGGLALAVVGWLVLKPAISIHLISYLGLATLLQVFFTMLVYWAELSAVGAHASLSQAVTYTGAANLALFVSLTPGALGFRESFLLLSRHLHHISSANIVAANVLDRAVYVVFLGLLFVVILALHAKDKFIDT